MHETQAPRHPTRYCRLPQRPIGLLAGLAGWGFDIVTGGGGINDTAATCITEAHGPLVTNPDHPAYLGAQAFTNNTAELTALGETLRNLISQADTLPSGRCIIRQDSELAAACAQWVPSNCLSI